MNKKYKIKRGKIISNFYIIAIAIIIMLFFCVGYSIFSTTLTIQATATAKKSDTDLPIDIPTTPGGTDYVSMTVDNNVLQIVSQSIDGNTVNVDLKPTTSTLQTGETGTFTADFAGAKFNSLTTTCTCKFTITYTANGQEVQFIISLNFTR